MVVMLETVRARCSYLYNSLSEGNMQSIELIHVASTSNIFSSKAKRQKQGSDSDMQPMKAGSDKEN
jgi:hypothetical protein